MKKGIHPKYNKVSVVCSCGNKMSINSTVDYSLNLDVCNNCHPFYAGKQRDAIAKKRMDKFKQRFAILNLKLK